MENTITIQEKEEISGRKSTHRVFLENLKHPDVDKSRSNLWLNNRDLYI